MRYSITGPTRLRVDIEKLGRWTWKLTLAEGNTEYVTRVVRGGYPHAAAVARRWRDREDY